MNVQRLILKGLSRLPDGMLRAMGGKPIEIRGVPLDPMLQIIWKEGKKQPSIGTQQPADVRKTLEDAAEMMQNAVPQNVEVSERTIPGPDAPIPIRVFKPRGVPEPLPITLFFHFGGYVIGSYNICDGFCGILAERARTVVVNVDYRLAPEHPFPAPIEDALAAYRWATENGAEVGGDPARVAVAGDSAGGMSSAVVCQEAKRQGWPMPVCQVLIYPWLVVNSGLPSYEDYRDAYPLDAATMDWFAGYYFTDESQKPHRWAAPLNEPDLAGLPDAIVITAGYDPLRDEGEAYADRLREAGVATHFKCYESLTHSFSMFGGVVPAALRAMDEIADALRIRLHS
jgi:acetyl esterase